MCNSTVRQICWDVLYVNPLSAFQLSCSFVIYRVGERRGLTNCDFNVAHSLNLCKEYLNESTCKTQILLRRRTERFNKVYGMPFCVFICMKNYTLLRCGPFLAHPVCIHRLMQWCGNSIVQAVELVGYMMRHFALR